MKNRSAQMSTNPDTNAQWWKLPEGRRYDGVIGTVKRIRTNQAYRKTLDLLHASLYGALPIAGFGYASWSYQGPIREKLSLNIVRNMVGAVTSKVASKSKPRPKFLTDGGDYDQQTRAENLEKFVAGCFYEGKLYAKTTGSFTHCGIFGTGVIKTFAHPETKRIAYEKTMPWEIVVDDGESLYGSPRTMFQRKYYDRAVLKEIYASEDTEEARELAGHIDRCATDPEDAEYAYETTADQVLVTEAWHLPSGPGAGDGLRVVCINGADLEASEWTRDSFPFAFMRWSEPVVGFFGTGLAEELCGIQAEINKLLRQIQRGHHLIAGHYLVGNGADVTTAHINNDLSAIVRYTGTPPQYVAPTIISPEIYQHLWQLYAKGFEIAGISQLNATGQKPAGLNSGVAQREYQDIQSERFLEIGQRYEDFILEIAQQTIDCIRESGGYQVKGVNKDSVEYIDWGDVEMDEKDYVLKAWPVSMLPATPAGRMQWAEDMIAQQLIPPEDILEIIDFPDTEAYAERANAPRKLVERNIDWMLRKGEVVTPEPYDDHALALRLCNQAYHRARLTMVPEDRLQLLRDYMAATTQLMQPPPAPPVDPMAAQAPPMGAPAPMPVDPSMMQPPLPPEAMPMGGPPPPM